MPGLAAVAWTLAAGLAGLACLALVNFYVDPAQLYRTTRRPVRALRARKLDLLRWRRGKPVRTLILGSSRAYNLDLSAETAFPAPVFNMAVTAACTEDYLAAYHLVLAHQTEPLALLVIACEPPALHPSSKLPWEAYISQGYTAELERLGAMHRGPLWRWLQLFSVTHFRESANEWQRLHRARKLQALHKFQWRADGYGTWLDNPLRQDNPRLTARQLRSYPRTGLRYHTYQRIGEQRAVWLGQLLAACQAAGTQVLVYIPPEHPELVALTDKLSGGLIYPMVAQHLARALAEHGGMFQNWHDPACLGLSAADFRDAIHPRDSAQARIAAELARVLTAAGGSREDEGRADSAAG
jgi:hypothetical protein